MSGIPQQAVEKVFSPRCERVFYWAQVSPCHCERSEAIRIVRLRKNASLSFSFSASQVFDSHHIFSYNDSYQR